MMMNMKKMMMLAAMTAAIGSAGIFSSFAAVDEESIQIGWVQMGNDWYYLNTDGSRKTGWVQDAEGDGRGNQVWYYLNSNGVMVANTTMVIGGKEYTFNEDGSWVDESANQGATRGAFSGSTFTNGWSNIKVTFPSISYSADKDELLGFEEYFMNKDYDAIGRPRLSYDFQVETSSYGDSVELYYADMSANPSMTAAAYAQAMAGILAKTDFYTVKANATDVTVGGQVYSKISLVNDADMQMDLYCRKQDHYMVVLSASAETGRMSSLNSLISSITTAH